MLDEQFRVLVLRAMIAVRVQNELGVGQVLLEDIRIYCIDDYVIAAVHNERGLGDPFQISIGARIASHSRRNRVVPARSAVVSCDVDLPHPGSGGLDANRVVFPIQKGPHF